MHKIEDSHPEGDAALLLRPHADKQRVEAVGLPVFSIPEKRHMFTCTLDMFIVQLERVTTVKF